MTIHPDASVTITDNGSGIPVDLMPEQGLPEPRSPLVPTDKACGAVIFPSENGRLSLTVVF